MMDLVVNHTSDEHHWFVESRKSLDNPYRDYYIWRKGHNGNPPNNWGSSFGGSAWQYEPDTDMYFLHLFSTKQPDLNWQNKMVRQEVYKMMTWWLDKGIDGFRMDVINLISKVDNLPDGKISGLYGNGGPFFMNGPRVHEYLKEMNREVLSKYDIITVGETPGASIADAMRYTGDAEHELNMVFQFEHMELDMGPYGKWCENRVQLADLKNTMTKWQNGLAGNGWNSLYWNNHDQPRVVSRFGDDQKYWLESAKMLATCLHMMQGTPFIFQGEELGMTNVRFDSLTDYRDIETLNAYSELVGHKIKTPEEMMRCINKGSRDNARTPVQWDDTENAGFSTVTPWIKVNPNFTQINAARQVGDPDSIFNYYKRLIQLRKKLEIIAYGQFQLILNDHKQIFAFTRSLADQKLVVLCNFSSRKAVFSLPDDLVDRKAELIIGNYKKMAASVPLFELRPYEAIVYLINP